MPHSESQDDRNYFWDMCLGEHLLEFVEAGNSPLEVGTIIDTTIANSTGEQNTTFPPATPNSTAIPRKYRTLMTGRQVSQASVAFSQDQNQPYVQFTLTDEGTRLFAEYTRSHIGSYLAIALDKKILSSPVIKSAITEGKGIIEGRFTLDEAKNLATQLNRGQLPTNFRVISDEILFIGVDQ